MKWMIIKSRPACFSFWHSVLQHRSGELRPPTRPNLAAFDSIFSSIYPCERSFQLCLDNCTGNPRHSQTLPDTRRLSRNFLPLSKRKAANGTTAMSGSSSPLSSLSSAPPSDIGMPEITLSDKPVDAPSPTSDMSSPAASHNTPKRKRAPSPPHEETLADNEDVAVSDSARPARIQQRDLSSVRDLTMYSTLIHNFLI